MALASRPGTQKDTKAKLATHGLTTGAGSRDGLPSDDPKVFSQQNPPIPQRYLHLNGKFLLVRSVELNIFISIILVLKTASLGDLNV